jgi:predicted DCC family thiol-disulfide oxidoreductase YuxK
MEAPIEHPPVEHLLAKPVLLFDGVCNLCNRSVSFVIDHDPTGALRFASLQSKAAERILSALGRPYDAGALETMLFVEGGRVYDRSTAVLRVARHLRGWRWLATFEVVPRALRDAIYRLVAARRYAWFGKRDACRRPTPELRERFLED